MTHHPRNIKGHGSIPIVVLLGQILNILSLFALASLIPPKEIGIWMIMFQLATGIGSLALLRLDLAINTFKNRDDSSRLTLIAICTSSLVITFLGAFTIWLTNTNRIYNLMTFAMAWLSSVSICLIALASRFGKYLLVAALNGLINAGSVILGLYYFNFLSSLSSLFFGYMSCQLISIIWILLSLRIDIRNELNNSSVFQKKKNYSLLVENLSYPQWILPGSLLSIVRERIPIIMINYFIGQSAAGYYGLAIRILTAPANFVSSSMRPRFSNWINETEVLTKLKLQQFLEFEKRIFDFSIACCFAIIFCALNLDLSFIKNVSEFSYYLSIFAIVIVAQTPVTWIDRIFDSRGMFKTVLLLELVFTTASLVIFGCATQDFFSRDQLLFLIALLTVGYYVLFGSLSLQLLAVDLRRFGVWIVVRFLLYSGIFIVVSIITPNVNPVFFAAIIWASVFVLLVKIFTKSLE